jgi:hypothetical protein
MGLLMRVAAKHDCKKRLVSCTFSGRARRRRRRRRRTCVMKELS